MYKQIIIDKIQSVKQKRASGEDPSSSKAVCKDCKEIGHYSKNYYRCKLYKQTNVHDVGTSGKKRKQSDSIKQDKRAAKRQRYQVNINDICKSCKQPGHKSSRSFSCRNHRATKKETFEENLGFQYKAFTRKIPFDNIVKEEYARILKPAILSASNDLRNISFRAQIFVNYYIILWSHEMEENDIPHCIFERNFWYSICQLVNAKRVTLSLNLPPNMIAVWDAFRSVYPSIVYNKRLVAGTSQCLAEACMELATSYQNTIVENFEEHLLRFLYYHLQNVFITIDPGTLKNIAKDYCYQYVCRGEPIWPVNIALPPNLSEEMLKAGVDRECQRFRALISQRVTLHTLSKDPQIAYKFLEHILNQYEDEHSRHSSFDVRRLHLPRLFTILPKPSAHWRFVTISAIALSIFIKRPLPNGYVNQLRLFSSVFDFNKLRYQSVDELLPNGENELLFGNIVRSDGFAVDLLFYRRTSDESNDQSLIKNHDLSVSDFSIDEVTQIYRPSFIDPGRKSVFTAAMGLDLNDHEIRRCTTKEYYHLSGSTVYVKKLRENKDRAGITAIEAATPTAKTARTFSFWRFANHMLTNMDKLFSFYDFSTAKDRFNLYQGRQRAPEMMVNMLLDGGTKYNRKKRFKKKRNKKSKKEKRKRKKRKRSRKEKKKKPTDKGKGKSRQQPYKKERKWKPAKFAEKDKNKVPLIVFGNGMFGKDLVKLKGLRCGVVGIMWRCLKKREAAGDVLVVPIDEFNTSKVCNRCTTMSMEGHPNVRGSSVLVCKTCNTIWQRDVNAAKNMMSISLSTWAGNGRPEPYRRN